MIGLSSSLSRLVARCSCPPCLLALALVVYLTIKYSPVIGRHFRGTAAVHAAARSSPSSGASRSSSRPTTGCGLRGSLSPGADRRAGRRDRLLPRVPERPLELSALPRPSARPGLRHLHVRLSQSRSERSRARLRADAVDDRPRGPRPARRRWRTCGRGPITIRPALGSSASAGAGRRPCSRPPPSPTSGASITDGAFPTQGTMVAYIIRWAEIYVPSAVSARPDPDVALSASWPGPAGGDRSGR